MQRLRLGPLAEHRDLAGVVVKRNLVHECSDQQQASATHALKVDRFARVRQRSWIKSLSFIPDRPTTAFTIKLGRHVSLAAGVGLLLPPLVAELLVGIVL